MYRGYELEPQGDGEQAIYDRDGDLVTYADSQGDAKKIIDEWLDAP